MLVKITDETHMEQQMVEHKNASLLVVEFYATWCGPCRIIAPKLAELAETVPDIQFLLVDVDICDDIAATYKVMATPYFLFYKKGEIVEKFAGANFERFKKIIDDHIGVKEEAQATPEAVE